MSATSTSQTARTFTEALRAGGQNFIAGLLEARSDLRDPLPTDLAELAARATSSGSVARAIDRVDAWHRHVLLGLAVLSDPASLAELQTLIGQDRDATAVAVTRLRDQGLVWGADRGLHLVRAAREQFGSYPAGLAPTSPVPLDSAEVEARLAEAGPAARQILERLVWSPAGSVNGAGRATARGPIEALLAARLLRAADKDHVLLPREVAWQLREQRLTQDPVSPTPPPVVSRTVRRQLVDNGAAGAALDLVHDLEMVVRTAESGQLHLLRAGGLGQRDLNQLAASVGTTPEHAGFLLEAASAAGFLTPDGPVLAVTTAYDRWRSESTASRWHRLASCWLESGRRWVTPPGGHPLGPDGELPRLAELRPLALGLVCEAGLGQAPDPEWLVAAAAWRRPGLRRVGTTPLPDALADVSRELDWLGMTALGSASPLAALARTRPDQPVSDDIARMFPEPVEQVVIQADLTAMAGGPLSHRLAADLHLLADRESRGAGGVFRFSAGSLRRAFDAGWTADRVRVWMSDHSRTPVPQPLSYLIDDVARRHGSVRVGAAQTYLTVSDDTQLAALAAHPDAAQLGLRRAGPGVLVAAAEPEDVIAWLRERGLSPVAEDAYGRPLTTPSPHRVKLDRDQRHRPDVSAADAAAAVLEGARAVRAVGSGQSTAEALLLLTQATRRARRVRVSYVGPDGAAQERSLSPLDLDGGQLRAVDTEGAQVLTIPLSRISNIRMADDLPLD